MKKCDKCTYGQEISDHDERYYLNGFKKPTRLCGGVREPDVYHKLPCEDAWSKCEGKFYINKKHK